MLHLRYSHSHDWDLICTAFNRALQSCGIAAKRSGNLTEDVRLPSSVTELLDMILCPKVAISLNKRTFSIVLQEGRNFNGLACYEQRCQCGRPKLLEIFLPLTLAAGNVDVSLLQHVKKKCGEKQVDGPQLDIILSLCCKCMSNLLLFTR